MILVYDSLGYTITKAQIIGLNSVIRKHEHIQQRLWLQLNSSTHLNNRSYQYNMSTDNMIPTSAGEQFSRKNGPQQRVRSVIVHNVECGPQGRRLVKTSVEHRHKVYLEDDKYECYVSSVKKRRWSICNLLLGGAR